MAESVDIVIPTLGADWLAVAIGSALTQDYPGARCIVITDGPSPRARRLARMGRVVLIHDLLYVYNARMRDKSLERARMRSLLRVDVALSARPPVPAAEALRRKRSHLERLLALRPWAEGALAEKRPPQAAPAAISAHHAGIGTNATYIAPQGATGPLETKGR